MEKMAKRVNVFMADEFFRKTVGVIGRCVYTLNMFILTPSLKDCLLNPSFCARKTSLLVVLTLRAVKPV